MNILIEGIDNYGFADSSIITSKIFTEDNFHQKYEYEDAYYRYYELNGQLPIKELHYETAIIAIRYEEEIYIEAKSNITSSEYYSNDILFNYKDYSFALNTRQPNDYYFNGEEQYIHTIGLLGYSNEHNELVFLAFYYYTIDCVSYQFTDWASFIEENFNEYNWK